MELSLLLAVLGSIALLLVLVLWLRLSAFLALLLASIACGLLAGLSPSVVIEQIGAGMGGTLAYVATIVGLGAILGALLEQAGGTQVLAHYLLDRLGAGRAPAAFVLTGFLVAIPVFFDVAFVILAPVLYATSRRTGRSLLYYAIPLLAGLAVTHAFIPPTPGPIAVAEILGADLGWIILFGFLVGIPTVAVAGLWWGRRAGRRWYIAPPPSVAEADEVDAPPRVGLVVGIIFIPIVLILVHTLTQMLTKGGWWRAGGWTEALVFIGHPYVALLLSCLVALYWLGIRRGVGRARLQEIATRALGPAGIIILITGAGGVYKQMLTATGAGEALAGWLAQYALLPPLLAFVLAALIRILQGSATVAMITAAGLVAPALPALQLSMPRLALLVLGIAAGASTLSHLNDSGFWLVKQYLGMDEGTTLRTWTVMTVLLSVTALAAVLGLYLIT